MGPKEINMPTIDEVLNLQPQCFVGRQSVLDHHEQMLNKFFDDFFGNRKNFIHSNTSYPKMDIFEDDFYFCLDFAVPGVEEKDLDIEIVKETKLLTVKGSSRFLAQREKKHFYHLKELKQSAFTRTIQLPENIENEPEVCHLENGILKLAFKKIVYKEEKPTETIKKISIKKS
jgi:HSP20 family molecular chaperone IbpA